MRLFFHRPAEMQHMLGRLLDAAIADASYTDVHDRAMMYYRLLQHDVGVAARVLQASSRVDGLFVEEAPSELQVLSSCLSPLLRGDYSSSARHPAGSDLRGVQHTLGNLRRAVRTVHLGGGGSEEGERRER